SEDDRIAAPIPVPDPRLTRISQRTSESVQRKRRFTAIAAAVALAGIVLGTMLANNGAPDTGAVKTAATRPAELQFKPIALADGVSVVRNWRLEGSAGHRFIGTLTFSNSTDA